MEESLVAHARELLDANRYLTLGTVSPGGQPWTTPVYFSWGPDWEFYWMSTIDARHSQNLAARPAVSVTVFDSTVPAYQGRAVYAVGEAREVPPDALDGVLASYPGPPSRGGGAVSPDEVTGDAPWRMYQAAAAELWVLCPREPRQGCPLHDIAQDHRAQVF
ncbi:pyridoxamine 5'-phosphate oxidase family protein [Actinoplanes bogorensis]|uniref:Pyridoxamine 5'-phosphate oxidase family protein n=1 Tax=Paractinoplanes bogorensis TaxID=1610840 RepID=A0ABS5YG86_9ACTN|nr:pyridoxamine 5'-phosphate oxidase family protein [Actinoplanes bogorensis]MBU2662457.1 pyridoxamine 5'-phosphate oxidase family protein [Actinoplanes bogorensis]